jgi:Ca2+-binding RTX toxin-like protein
VDNTGDVIVDTAGVDTVIASFDFTLGAGLENLQAASTTTGLSLTGNELANILTGNAGADVLNGGIGIDTMAGGAGNDRYLVDSSFDVVTELSGGGVDTVIVSSTTYALAAAAEVEFLTAAAGRASLRLFGSESGNTITGNNGRNVLSGLGGNDVLAGGLGRDDLRGGLGKDTFVFNTRLSNSNMDRVLDFNVRDDLFQLENRYMSQVGRAGKLSSDAFVVSRTGAQDMQDRIIYNDQTGMLTYDFNGSAFGGERVIARLTRDLDLTHRDFFIT